MTTSAMPAPKENRKWDKRASGPRFTAEELTVIHQATAIEDRSLSNLIRVATLLYARDVIARER